MRKSIEQLQAEQIVASLLRNNNGDAKCVLNKARKYAEDFKFSIAQRVTITIFLATLYDYYEDFTEKDVIKIYSEYLKYFDSFDKGNENIFNQMIAINEMLGGELLSDKMFDVIAEKAKEG